MSEWRKSWAMEEKQVTVVSVCEVDAVEILKYVNGCLSKCLELGQCNRRLAKQCARVHVWEAVFRCRPAAAAAYGT